MDAGLRLTQKPGKRGLALLTGFAAHFTAIDRQRSLRPRVTSVQSNDFKSKFKHLRLLVGRQRFAALAVDFFEDHLVKVFARGRPLD